MNGPDDSGTMHERFVICTAGLFFSNLCMGPHMVPDCYLRVNLAKIDILTSNGLSVTDYTLSLYPWYRKHHVFQFLGNENLSSDKLCMYACVELKKKHLLHPLL